MERSKNFSHPIGDCPGEAAAKDAYSRYSAISRYRTRSADVRTSSDATVTRHQFWVSVCLATFLFALLPMCAHAQYTESVLYSFCQQGGLCPDGDEPEQATPIFDSQGNLYGTVFHGGANNGGAVYELSPPPGGSGLWTEALLYSFCQSSGCPDGQWPAASLIFDANGNLYGTTRSGGNSSQGGVVFELSPPAGGHGPWTE